MPATTTQDPATTLARAEPRCPLDDETLMRFTKQEHPIHSTILTVEHYRGDLTQSGDDRTHLAMGELAYSHYHWDTEVTNGRVLLRIPRFKHPRGVQPPRGQVAIPADWSWAMSQVETYEDCGPERSAAVERVPQDIRTLVLSTLPALEWVKVWQVNFWSHSGRGPSKRKHQPAPKEIVFIKFTGGTGVCIAPAKTKN